MTTTQVLRAGRRTGPAYGLALPFDLTGAPSARDLANGDWRLDATCRDRDHEWWFAKPTSARSRSAVQLCEGCPVRQQCLAAGLLFGEEFGVWGGLTHIQRRPLIARLLTGVPLATVLATALGEQHVVKFEAA
jgi:WhiB family redox-sensing transcriptional regulator